MARRMHPTERALKGAEGFAYIGMLFALALCGIGLGVLVPSVSDQVRRERENELIEAGTTLARALETYARGSQGVERRYPESLDRLLLDDRFVRTRRHLRRLPYDPVAKSDAWGVVRDGKGGIVGVRSLAEGKPIRHRPPAGVVLDGIGDRYRDWVFAAVQERKP